MDGSATGHGTSCSFLYLHPLASVSQGKDPNTLQPGQVGGDTMCHQKKVSHVYHAVLQSDSKKCSAGFLYIISRNLQATQILEHTCIGLTKGTYGHFFKCFH